MYQTKFNARVQQLCFFYHFYNRTGSDVCSKHGDVRLVNGAGPYEGRVEICYSGEWKTVCDDYWSSYMASIVCAQLNYPPQGECTIRISQCVLRVSVTVPYFFFFFFFFADALALYRARFGQGSGSILERTYCSGSELKLIDCSLIDYPDYYHYYYCDHADDAGVSCCK